MQLPLLACIPYACVSEFSSYSNCLAKSLYTVHAIHFCSRFVALCSTTSDRWEHVVTRLENKVEELAVVQVYVPKQLSRSQYNANFTLVPSARYCT